MSCFSFRILDCDLLCYSITDVDKPEKESDAELESDNPENENEVIG